MRAGGGEPEAIRASGRTGRPLGDKGFIRNLQNFVPCADLHLRTTIGPIVAHASPTAEAKMHDDLERRIKRIEGKVDAVLGLAMLAFGLWCADRLTALFQRTFGWPRDLTFFLTAVVLYLGFVFWFERKYNSR